MIETAVRTVAEQLRAPRVKSALHDLPQGEPHKIARPDGPPHTWPQIVPAVHARPAAA